MSPPAEKARPAPVSTITSVVELLRGRHPAAVELLAGPPEADVGEIRLVEQAEQIDEAPALPLPAVTPRP